MMKNRILSLTAAMVLTLSAQAAHINTDRSWYLAGEAMKVNVSAVDNAQIAYAELCDANGLAASAVVNLKQGNGACTIELPSSLHSGYYVLSVYTRNNDRVLNKLVAVVNTLHKSLDDDITWTKADSCYVTAKGAAELINKKNTDVRETEGQIIKARINNVYGGKTYKADQIRASLSIIGKQIHYFEGKMEDDSTAVFYTFGVHGKQPLVLSAVTSTDVSLPIEMISPFEALLPKKLPHLVFNYKRSQAYIGDLYRSYGVGYGYTGRVYRRGYRRSPTVGIQRQRIWHQARPVVQSRRIPSVPHHQGGTDRICKLRNQEKSQGHIKAVCTPRAGALQHHSAIADTDRRHAGTRRRATAEIRCPPYSLYQHLWRSVHIWQYGI